MTPDAVSYRNKGAEMRRFAEEARDAGSRRQFLDVAAQYDKLAHDSTEGHQVTPAESLTVARTLLRRQPYDQGEAARRGAAAGAGRCGFRQEKARPMRRC
jgi:hypothetical protein